MVFISGKLSAIIGGKPKFQGNCFENEAEVNYNYQRGPSITWVPFLFRAINEILNQQSLCSQPRKC